MASPRNWVTYCSRRAYKAVSSDEIRTVLSISVRAAREGVGPVDTGRTPPLTARGAQRGNDPCFPRGQLRQVLSKSPVDTVAGCYGPAAAGSVFERRELDDQVSHRRQHQVRHSWPPTVQNAQHRGLETDPSCARSRGRSREGGDVSGGCSPPTARPLRGTGLDGLKGAVFQAGGRERPDVPPHQIPSRGVAGLRDEPRDGPGVRGDSRASAPRRRPGQPCFVPQVSRPETYSASSLRVVP